MARVTSQELKKVLGRKGASSPGAAGIPGGAGIFPAAGGFARGRTVPKDAAGMNKLEARYALELEVRRRAGEVLWFLFEPFNLRLAERTYYRPDFAVMLADGTLEVHEVKGFWEDDARVKVKVAAARFPFVFRAVTEKKGVWRFEEF